MTKRVVLAVIALAIISLGRAVDARADPAVEFEAGTPILQILNTMRQRGVPLVYSTSLVPEHLRVLGVPPEGPDIERLDFALRAHGLALRRTNGFWQVVRLSTNRSDDTADEVASASAGDSSVIDVITVSASRYRLQRDRGDAPVPLSQQAIERLPDFGNDPVRALQRLPGAAAGGTSARAHFRGGDENETGLILNGHRLLDPFHVRDYHNLFSAIDVRAIDAMEVYTGGFPARYGDRLSGVVLIDSLTPDEPRRTELGLSVFNTSFLTAGLADDDKLAWLLTGRSSNLDLVLSERYGKPSYYDVFGEFQFAPTDELRITLNGLLADDSVVVATENAVDEIERSRSDTRNMQFWARVEYDWTDRLRSTTLLASAGLDISREADNNQPDKIVASVLDRRDVSVAELRQDWTYAAAGSHRLSWGFGYQTLEANYAYAAQAEYFDFFAAFESVDDTVSRALAVAVDGEVYAAYLSDRWQIGDRLTAEAGLRWDKQTYTGSAADEQVSPRFSALYEISDNVRLRASWGRYYQSQDLHELHIEDGETAYHPAQRADQFIVGLQSKLGDRIALRIEYYDKSMRRLQPRYENLYDPLAIIPELEPDRVRIAPTAANARGLEFSLNRDGDDFSWWATYVISRVHDTIDGRHVERNWDQRHALQAGLHRRAGPWEFSAALNFHSGWPTTRLLLQFDDDGEAVLAFAERNAERLGTYASIDARLSRRFALPRGSLTAFAEIANISDRRNPCCVDFELEDTPGGSVLVRSEEFWLPILPAIGILWEF